MFSPSLTLSSKKRKAARRARRQVISDGMTTTVLQSPDTPKMSKKPIAKVSGMENAAGKENVHSNTNSSVLPVGFVPSLLQKSGLMVQKNSGRSNDENIIKDNTTHSKEAFLDEKRRLARRNDRRKRATVFHDGFSTVVMQSPDTPVDMVERARAKAKAIDDKENCVDEKKNLVYEMDVEGLTRDETGTPNGFELNTKSSMSESNSFDVNKSDANDNEIHNDNDNEIHNDNENDNENENDDVESSNGVKEIIAKINEKTKDDPSKHTVVPQQHLQQQQHDGILEKENSSDVSTLADENKFAETTETEHVTNAITTQHEQEVVVDTEESNPNISNITAETTETTETTESTGTRVLDEPVSMISPMSRGLSITPPPTTTQSHSSPGDKVVDDGVRMEVKNLRGIELAIEMEKREVRTVRMEPRLQASSQKRTLDSGQSDPEESAPRTPGGVTPKELRSAIDRYIKKRDAEVMIKKERERKLKLKSTAISLLR